MELLIISIGVMILIAATGIIVTASIYIALTKRMERMRHDGSEYIPRIHSEDE